MAPIARPRAVPFARASPEFPLRRGLSLPSDVPPHAMPGMKAALIAAELALVAVGAVSIVTMLALAL